MARVRFLADANLDQNIVAGILRRERRVAFELRGSGSAFNSLALKAEPRT